MDLFGAGGSGVGSESLGAELRGVEGGGEEGGEDGIGGEGVQRGGGFGREGRGGLFFEGCKLLDRGLR